MPLHNMLGLIALGPHRGIQKVLSLSAGKGVVPHSVGIATLWSFCQTQRCHNNTVARSRDSNQSSQYRREHRASLAVVFIAAAATAVLFLQPNEQKRRQEHQQASSYNASKVPHEAAEVALGSVFCFPIRKVEQNISYDAEDSSPHQRESDVSCTLYIAHSGSRSPARLCSVPSLQLSGATDGMMECPFVEKEMFQKNQGHPYMEDKAVKVKSGLPWRPQAVGDTRATGYLPR